jgi:hypothetical protein
MRKKEKEDGDDLREEPWEAGDDLALAKAHLDGVNQKELAKKFGRSMEEIGSRISSILLEDGKKGYSNAGKLNQRALAILNERNGGREHVGIAVELRRKGYLTTYRKKSFLTIKGYEKGGRFMTRGTVWFVVWPDDFLTQYLNEQLPSVNVDKGKNGEETVLDKPNAGKPWSAEDDVALAKAHGNGVDPKLLAKRFGRSVGGIRSRIKNILLEDGTILDRSNAGKPWSRADDDALAKAHGNGVDPKLLAKRFGRSKGAINSRIKNLLLEDGRVLGHSNNLLSKSTKLKKDHVKKDKRSKKPVSLRKVVGKKFVKDDEFPGFYLNGYIPYRTGEQDPFSKRILKLKNEKKKAIRRFAGKLKALKACEFAVCAVPGHDSVSSNYSSGIRKLAKELGKLPGVTDLSGNLLRKHEIPKKSGGGKRDLATDLKSLKLKKSASFRGKEILLLDDVATTWTTMKACRMTIEKVGPKDVVPFVLGRTISS